MRWRKALLQNGLKGNISNYRSVASTFIKTQYPSVQNLDQSFLSTRIPTSSADTQPLDMFSHIGSADRQLAHNSFETSISPREHVQEDLVLESNLLRTKYATGTLAVEGVNWHRDELVYTYDLSHLRYLYLQWATLLPQVMPYYAVKCNPDPEILRTLGDCGANFDCASPAEIRSILDLGISPKRIIYANPCKKESDIRFMWESGVTKTTFDSICELDKIARNAPEVECIIRLYANDPTAQCVLSNKFGAFPEEWEGLLAHAASLKLRVTGISFHVGSGACNPDVYRHALEQSRQLYDLARTYGFNLEIIDIGGGFRNQTLPRMAESIQFAIEKYFYADTPMDSLPVTFIAEPGRYFAETIGTLYTKVIGVRERRNSIDLFITDSLYGSFNSILYDHVQPTPESLNPVPIDVQHLPTTIFGPTCDGFDKILDSVMLPRFNYGDWLVWRNMGAYTIAGACDFNGINFLSPKRCYLN
jgi:ornithine decarboxylase